MLSWREVFKKVLRYIFFDNNCSYCHKELDRDGYICYTCLKKLKENSSLKNKDNFFYVYIYDKAIRQIISDYKLRNRKTMVNDLAYLIEKPLKELIEKENIDVVIPVPVSKNRELERGFNQIDYLLSTLQITYKKIERVKDTKHMYSLDNYKKREKNVKKAFKTELKLQNKKVLIVDDIVTSGATINEISKEIKSNNEGVEIVIFSIAISKHFI
ncbi:ComF family protein [Fusobacterium massiliense]|uniref:ComF family protein n=1 Tax=Fusobacterium massiliense TaxID=1852365 RepID=UPI0028D01FDD|nr:ComF family protein [Fusobacterium massiliense]